MSTSNAATETLISLDPWLKPYEGVFNYRAWLADHQRARLVEPHKSLQEFALGHEYFGLHKCAAGWVFRERAPHASRITLIGDFSNWEISSQFDLTRVEDGTWEIALHEGVLQHGMHYKMVVYWNELGREVRGERIPSFCRRVVQDPETLAFSAQVWNPARAYEWKSAPCAVSTRNPRIYEAHVGMAGEQPRVGTYVEFTHSVLPRIAEAGYNTIQLMAVQEHPYYGSFGYQVSSFFAPSSRFGTPEELMELVDTAHGYGIAVIMDLVHSHAVKNEVEGLSRLDGSYTLYFHEGLRGEHPAWNTRLFNYGKTETLHFLLSNCRYWLDAFRFDGFRFDGVTSMIYRDHGLGSHVTSYDHYFGGNIDEDALAYLTLANSLIHELRPDAITIAEEVSALPGLAAPTSMKGVGFDFRLAMGVPDYWIKLLKHVPDEQWRVSDLWAELTSKRPEEKTIQYCESHDQALVGDKSIMFWLADKEMYWHMQIDDHNHVIDRAIALHKLIRLLTLSLGGDGYLTFMGNEFGHPEWVDFPREGNGWSYHYARRQWSLRDNNRLKYAYLAEFDRELMMLDERYGVLAGGQPQKVYEHVDDMVLGYQRAGLLFVCNLHPTRSCEDRAIPGAAEEYTVVLDSNDAVFGGSARSLERTIRPDPKSAQVHLSLPSRTALVLKPRA